MSSGAVTRDESVAAARPEIPPVNRAGIGLGAASRVVLAGACSASRRIAVDTQDFGREIVDAIERNYRPASTVGGDWIYEPNPEP